MWLMPCSRSTWRAVSAWALEALPSAAAPKITRLDSCPVAPKGARSIMKKRVMGRRARSPRGCCPDGPRRLRGEAQARAGYADAGPDDRSGSQPAARERAREGRPAELHD